MGAPTPARCLFPRAEVAVPLCSPVPSARPLGCSLAGCGCASHSRLADFHALHCRAAWSRPFFAAGGPSRFFRTRRPARIFEPEEPQMDADGSGRPLVASPREELAAWALVTCLVLSGLLVLVAALVGN